MLASNPVSEVVSIIIKKIILFLFFFLKFSLTLHHINNSFNFMNISQKNIVLNVFFNMSNLDINAYSLAKDRLKLCAYRKTLERFCT
jgi:hypothetical protein